LLPPSVGDVGDVEAQDEGQGDEVQEGVEINNNHLEQYFLRSCEDLSVDQGEEDVRGDEEEEFPVDEFVQGTLPFEEEPGESTGRGRGHIALVGDGHGGQLTR